MRFIATVVMMVLVAGCNGGDDRDAASSTSVPTEEVGYYAEIQRVNSDWSPKFAENFRDIVCDLKDDGLTLQEVLDVEIPAETEAGDVEGVTILGGRIAEETRIAYRWCGR